MNGSCYALQATDNLSRQQCKKRWCVRFSKTEAQQELSMTPDHSIKECAKRKPYIKENWSSRKIIMNYKKLYSLLYIHIVHVYNSMRTYYYAIPFLIYFVKEPFSNTWKLTLLKTSKHGASPCKG